MEWLDATGGAVSFIERATFVKEGNRYVAAGMWKGMLGGRGAEGPTLGADLAGAFGGY